MAAQPNDDKPAETFRPSRPRSEFMAELKRRYTAVQPPTLAAREQAAERQRTAENRRRLEILRVFR
jgi:hypothetical protein